MVWNFSRSTQRHSFSRYVNVFAALDTDAFLSCLVQWTQALTQTIHPEIVAIAPGLKQTIVLGQIKVDQKSNEITVRCTRK